MNTNYTYRFVNVAEQVLTMIGEGKHGLWRVQESGTVCEYLEKDATGLTENSDILAKDNLAKIESDYSAYLPTEGWTGYKYPDEKLNKNGHLNYIDLPITHPKYKNKYVKHEPIELPNWYCTISENDYPYAQQVMNFAFKQPGANIIGPLGKRAGLDVNENYTKVIRLNQLPDARSWVNVGQPNKDSTHVKWEAIDTTKTNTEYYLVERPFFNKPYLFIARAIIQISMLYMGRMLVMRLKMLQILILITMVSYFSIFTQDRVIPIIWKCLTTSTSSTVI